jgi:putative phosphoribosyl transferase
MREIFRNRIEAGQLLAGKLMRYANQPNVIVLGLPRGGVPVAFEVAKALRAPLDVFVVRKLGTPGNREVAMGAIAAGGVRVLNEEVVVGLGIPIEVIDAVTAEEKQELERRELAYRGSYAEPEVRGKTVILIDDGIATGSTVRAAVRAFEIPTSRAVHRRRADITLGKRGDLHSRRVASASLCQKEAVRKLFA